MKKYILCGLLFIAILLFIPLLIIHNDLKRLILRDIIAYPAISGDGSIAVFCSNYPNDPSIYVYQIDTREMTYTMLACIHSKSKISGLCISKDGNCISYTNLDGYLYVYNIYKLDINNSLRLTCTLKDNNYLLCHPSFNANGSILVFSEFNITRIGKEDYSSRICIYSNVTKKIQYIGGSKSNKCDFPRVDSSGRYIAFVAYVTTASRDTDIVYVFDLKQRDYQNIGYGMTPMINDTGNIITYVSHCKNGLTDIRVFDRIKKKAYLANIADNGNRLLGNAGYYVSLNSEAIDSTATSSISISGDGKSVAFVSDTSSIVPGNNGVINLILHNFSANKTTLISRSSEHSLSKSSLGNSAIALNDAGTDALIISDGLLKSDNGARKNIYYYNYINNKIIGIIF